jgi:TRIAP1/MDM35 family protein
MAHSLSPECTPLKLEYDACFNSWFESYLEPALATSANTEQRAAYSKTKAEEFESKCGKIWARYRECVQVRLQYSLLVMRPERRHRKR